MIGIILIIIATALTIYHFFTHYNRTGRVVNKIRGPTAYPLVGNAYEFFGPFENVPKTVSRINSEYYPINRLWMGGMPTISIYHPDDVQILLRNKENIDKSSIYNFIHPWLGRGLLTNAGELWQIRRKILTPAFHFDVLQEYLNVFVEQSELFVKNLQSEGNEIVKDIVPLLTKFTLDSICETAMGTVLDKEKNGKEYRNGVHKMGTYFLHRLLSPWLHQSWFFNLTPTGFNQRKLLQSLHHFTDNIISSRRQYHEQKSKENISFLNAYPNDEVVTVSKKRVAMLDILIAASRKEGSIDDVGIREEVDTFVFEGHDTTAVGLIFLLPLLAEHKEIQERARMEVTQVMKQSGGKLGMKEVNKMIYLERCIKESLRLYPSVPTIARELKTDLQLKNGLAPEGSNIILYINDLHRNPNFWINPTKFDPDRFLPENSEKRHPFSYVPFSAGLRNCIGQKFALLEMKTLAAQLLYYFDLEPVDFAHEIKFLQDFVIRPIQPVRIKFISK